MATNEAQRFERKEQLESEWEKVTKDLNPEYEGEILIAGTEKDGFFIKGDISPMMFPVILHSMISMNENAFLEALMIVLKNMNCKLESTPESE